MPEVGYRLLLAVDIGNINTSVGLFDGSKLKYQWRISTDRNRTSDETGILFRSLFQSAGVNMESIKDVVICSVVPPVMHSFTNAIIKYADKKPLIVGPGTKTGINIKYENPREVGADKIVNAVGAVKLYGAPVIIVDFGTATTYCAISRNGDYLGGIICPGNTISAEALFDKAAKLPRVEFAEPRYVIGRNTETSIQSGLFYGSAGQVEYLVRIIKREMREENAKVVATGSAAMFIASKLKCVDEVNMVLTLEGLREIYYMNI